MMRPDYSALLPLMIVAYGGALLMVLIAFWRSHKAAFALTLAILAAAFASIFTTQAFPQHMVTSLITVNGYSLFFWGLILAGAFLAALLCYGYLANHTTRPREFYVLLLFAVSGMMTLAAASHFISLLLGLEILSASLFGLIGYTTRTKLSTEAAIKYLILAATATGFLLLGTALIYADFGTMNLPRVVSLLVANGFSLTSLFGVALVLVALGFKLAFVPFHMWSPDVYQGSPAPVTALIATGSKGASFAALLTLSVYLGFRHPTIALALTVLAILTMTGGNLLALLQTNIKRMLAYSSVAHMGYLLIPLIAGGTAGMSSIAFYFASYFVTTIAAFGVVTALSAKMRIGDADNLEDYRGLSRRNPMLAAVMTVALLSLIGIPLTSGFFAKLYIFSAAVEVRLWLLLTVGVVNTGMSAFYYLRVVIAMYSPTSGEAESAVSVDSPTQIALAICSAVIVFLGVYPTPLVKLAETAVQSLFR